MFAEYAGMLPAALLPTTMTDDIPMPIHHDLDDILQDWPYQPRTVSARLVRAADGREVLQMRVDMGVLQMETSGRPDGAPACLNPSGGAYRVQLMRCDNLPR